MTVRSRIRAVAAPCRCRQNSAEAVQSQEPVLDIRCRRPFRARRELRCDRWRQPTRSRRCQTDHCPEIQSRLTSPNLHVNEHMHCSATTALLAVISTYKVGI